MARDYPIDLALVILVAYLGITYLIAEHSLCVPRSAGADRRTVAQGRLKCRPRLPPLLIRAKRSSHPRRADQFSVGQGAILSPEAGRIRVGHCSGVRYPGDLAPWVAPTAMTRRISSMRINFRAGSSRSALIRSGTTVRSGDFSASARPLIVAGGAVSMACLIGIPPRGGCGLRGGWTDFIASCALWRSWLRSQASCLRFSWLSHDQQSRIPDFAQQSGLNVGLVSAITSWVPLCRLMRAQILTLREQRIVTSARAIGASEIRVAVTHLFPNAIPPMIIALTLGVPAAIFAEAGLSSLESVSTSRCPASARWCPTVASTFSCIGILRSSPRWPLRWQCWDLRFLGMVCGMLWTRARYRNRVAQWRVTSMKGSVCV